MSARFVGRCAVRHLIALSVVVLTVASCTRITQREYGPFLRELDGLSELEISTYPADYPDRLSERGALFEQLESADLVYLQVHVRDQEKKFGPNEHVSAITIHRFAYQLGPEDPVVLLRDYSYNFWMQGNPKYDKQELPALRYSPDEKLKVEISFTLNGEYYEFRGEMPASESSSVWPTAIVNQGV